MDLTPYVDGLHAELVVAAEAGGDEARALAERLLGPLESSTRLALLEALSAAADEITRDLAPGSVEVRLRGRDPEFVVSAPLPEPAEPEPVAATGTGPIAIYAAGRQPPGQPDLLIGAEEGGTSRITLRLPDHLKPRIDDAAAQAGLSVNAWMVRVVAAALDPGGSGGRPPRSGTHLGQRFTGWVR
jgi:hypothetical protein